MPETMTGAEALVHSLVASGIDTCFANPGTSEMHFVAALDRIPGIRCVLGLQENVVTGMADGYFRVTGRPAATLLHCGPGLANGLANLHNARRADSAIVNIVGDHATFHLPHDAPLTSDIAGLARTVSSQVHSSRSPQEIGGDTARTVAAARHYPGSTATLILPADVSWSEGGETAAALPVPPPAAPDALALRTAAEMIRAGDCLILLGGDAVSLEAQAIAGPLAAATGATLMASFTVSRQPMGQGRLDIQKVPYPVDMAIEALAPFRQVILVNCPPPVGFFGYPGKPSLLCRPDARVHVLSRVEECPLAALRGLAEAFGPLPPHAVAERPPLCPGTGPIEPMGFAETVCALLPENALVIDESITLGIGLPAAAPRALPHERLTITGGAIGGGLPLATGAAIGAAMAGRPDRRVIALQADGSAAYTMQALWTQAREALPVTTLLLSNRSYAILLGEYAKVGAAPGPTAFGMMELDRPALDWCGLARGMGVEAARADTLETLAELMRAALARPGPFLIEVDFTG